MHKVIFILFILSQQLVFSQQDSTNSKFSESNTKTLKELCQKYQTDKCDILHNYIQIYERLFSPIRPSTKKVFEIGILSGASHKLWKEYFMNAEIYGIDIEDCSIYEKDGIHTMIADQSKREDLKKFIDKYDGQYDIIIDDGGHTMDQQQISLGFLFKYLKKGGIYVIEDIHTSLTKYYKGFGVNEFSSNSTYTMIVQYMSTGNIASEYLQQDEINYIRTNIEFCELIYITNSMHSMMCVIKKK